MQTYSTLVIFGSVLILIKSANSCMTLTGKPGNELPSFERPNLNYKRVPAKSNCVEKFMSKSDNDGMKDFYNDFNNHLRIFLNQTKHNQLSLLGYQLAAEHLKEEYSDFHRNISKYKRQCMGFSSYKSLHEITGRMKNIMPYFASFKQEQYQALGNDGCINCLLGHYNNILNCTTIEFEFVPEYHYRPKEERRKKIKQPARPTKEHKKEVVIPQTAICGTPYHEIMECAEHAFTGCSEDEKSSSLHIVESLLKFVQIPNNHEECFDLYPMLTFETILQKLLNIKVVNTNINN